MSELALRRQQLRRGDIVLQFLGSANRDPAVYERPEVLDVARPGVKHVAFGHGAHFRLSAALARLETQVALHEAIHGPWYIEVLGEAPVWKDGLLRGLESLAVRVITR